MLAALTDAGFKINIEPQGGLYIFADAARFTDDSEVLCQELVEHAGVSVAPGRDFGNYPTHVRISLGVELPRLLEAVRRMSQYLRLRP